MKFAVTIPFFVFLLFGSLEIGRALTASCMLEETARAACRLATFENCTKQDILDVVATSMDAANIDKYTVTIDPDSSEIFNPLQPIRIHVSTPYSSVSWIPSIGLMPNARLEGSWTMPTEGDRTPQR